MSRIGKIPIEVPAGVTVDINDNVVMARGPKGILTKEFHKDIIIGKEGGNILVTRPSDNKLHRSLHGLTRTLISNMVEGVDKGFEKTLEINGVGYRAQKQGDKLVLSLGFSHPVEMEEPEGITFEVPSPNRIIVKGCDKQVVGEYAAKIRKKRPPEVYKGKGIKYEKETIRRKEGKTGAKTRI